ncbi:MAG: carbonic anhydrase [Alphaproteobacteria bacterium]|nr:MAG: carbonic anhydrase [Alphaproteobacteria bacterium]
MDQLLEGYRRFRNGRYQEQKALYTELAEQGQSPKTMIISCCDSRVDPAIVLDADPGAVFAVRNVANLVPPARPDGAYHGTSAALEFAVLHLGVEHIVVMGHAQCGGVKALYEDLDKGADFIIPWMQIVKEARDRVRSSAADKPHAEQLREMEQEAIRVSLDNLLSFPWVKERVDAGTIQLHGWYFDINDGIVWALDQKTGSFRPVE